MGGLLGFVDKYKPIHKVLANASILARAGGALIDVFITEPTGKPWFAVTTETPERSILLTVSFRLKNQFVYFY